jgi:hypothetical protein
MTVRKRLRRLALTTSLLFLLATTVGWIRGHWATDHLDYLSVLGNGNNVPMRQVGVTLYRGSVEFSWYEMTLGTLSPVAAGKFQKDVRARAGLLRRSTQPSRHQYRPSRLYSAQYGAAQWGFGWQSVVADSYSHFYFDQGEGARRAQIENLSGYSIALPWWLLALLFSLAPARALWKWARTRRHSPQACQSCGYDLRATPDPKGPLLKICPECGQPAPIAYV